METLEETPPVNPWLSVWVHPRKTIRQVIAEEKEGILYTLAAMVGITNSINNAGSSVVNEGATMLWAAIVVLIIGPLAGIFGMFVAAWVLEKTGNWLGGLGTRHELKYAFGWANVPSIISLIALLLVLPYAGEALFNNSPDAAGEMSIIEGLLLLAYGLLAIAMGIWTFILYIGMIAEVHQFSAWKAFLSLMLPAIAIGLIVGIVTMM